jgi:hypothetical protein
MARMVVSPPKSLAAYSDCSLASGNRETLGMGQTHVWIWVLSTG